MYYNVVLALVLIYLTVIRLLSFSADVDDIFFHEILFKIQVLKRCKFISFMTPSNKINENYPNQH